MTHTQELQKEHKELARLVAMVQENDSTYTGPEGFCEEFNAWLAKLDAQNVDQMEDQAEWQSAVSNGFTFS